MHAPTARIFGLRAATNRAKKARSRGLPAFDSRVRRCSDQSLTLFYGFLDFASYTLTYDNAGHPGPVILAKGAVPSVLQSSGLPGGVLEQAEYEDAEVRLRPRDQFWLYSDGLQKAMNPAGERFGKGRLVTSCRLRPETRWARGSGRCCGRLRIRPGRGSLRATSSWSPYRPLLTFEGPLASSTRCYPANPRHPCQERCALVGSTTCAKSRARCFGVVGPRRATRQLVKMTGRSLRERSGRTVR